MDREGGLAPSSACTLSHRCQGSGSSGIVLAGVCRGEGVCGGDELESPVEFEDSERAGL